MNDDIVYTEQNPHILIKPITITPYPMAVLSSNEISYLYSLGSDQRVIDIQVVVGCNQQCMTLAGRDAKERGLGLCISVREHVHLCKL